MKTAIVSANIGMFDHEYQPPVQDITCDSVYITDQNIPFEFPALNNRLRSQYPKMLSHEVTDANTIIWRDSSIRISSRSYAAFMLKQLGSADVAAPFHPHRRTVSEEIETIRQLFRDGNPYFSSRYNSGNFNAEINFYESEGFPMDSPLYACYTFARRATKHVNGIFEQWWMMNLKLSGFDQVLFSYIAWKHNLRVNGFTADQLNAFMIREKHKPFTK